MNIVVVSLALSAGEACKPRPKSGLRSEAAGLNIDHGLPLTAVDYPQEQELAKFVATRAGCEAMAKHFVGVDLKTRSLADALKSISEPKTDYLKIKGLVFEQTAMESACQSGGMANTSSGFQNLWNQLSQGNSLPVLVVADGFGREFGGKRTLASSIVRWKGSVPNAEIWSVGCSQSFESDSECTRTIQGQLSEKLKKLPSGKSVKLLLWGYSRGGLGLFEVLRNDAEIQRNTVAAVFVGVPFGGLVTGYLTRQLQVNGLSSYDSLLDKLGAKLALSLEERRALPELASLLLPLIESQIPAEITETVKGLGQSQEYVMSHLPPQGLNYLNSLKASANLGQVDRDIPVYFLSGVLDLPRLRPIPPPFAEAGDGHGSSGFDFNSIRTILFAPLLREFPLSDGIVAFEHSIIPRAYLPKPFSGHLSGLIATDHAGLAFSGRSPRKNIDDAIVEGMFDTISTDLRGGGAR